MVILENLGIRAIEIEDLAIIQKYRNDEILRQYFREYREFSLTQIKDWYFNMIKDNRFEMFVIIDLDNEEKKNFENSIVAVKELFEAAKKIDSLLG